MNFIHDDEAASSADDAVIGERLLSRMQQRTQEREQRSQQRRDQVTNRNTELENDDAFLTSFNEMKIKLEEDLKNVTQRSTADKSELESCFEKMTRDHGLIQQYINESSMFLSQYLLKRSQESLASLDVEIRNKMSEMIPKKRFGFRGRSNLPPKTAVTPDVVDSASEVQRNSALEQLLEKNFYGFRDLSSEKLTLNAAEVHNRQVNLVNLIDCTVTILGNPGGMQAAGLTNCTVVVGPMSRSAFIKNCVDCRFVLACQQVRIHDTKDSQFYLHVTGAAIIESCNNVGFAPFNLNYDQLDEHYTSSGLDRSINKWDKVDDFKWLNSEEKSPNMFLIPEENRQTEWLTST
ncbi:hypothetical protein HAZT_HAZT009793 [Hyalella azteca]|uniref:Tubulin-specific chaperone C-like n=1 Tax=Hyalella azteca TaxID=294128 RepID=A0A6A0GXA9_HYAAZ|nr:tubulin-specific chaperone C-like [Hyalella azteca]KAA0190409.1 hypothetical protein HAZT_HAZT009793 [Hyalella azteca]